MDEFSPLPTREPATWQSDAERKFERSPRSWLPFLFIPLSAVSYVGVPPDRTNEASAMINLMRNLGGSVGVSFTTTMLQQRCLRSTI